MPKVKELVSEEEQLFQLPISGVPISLHVPELYGVLILYFGIMCYVNVEGH
jgi:hypothetical protein